MIDCDSVAELDDKEPFGTITTLDRKSTRLNSSHGYISYAVFCLKKKNKKITPQSLQITAAISIASRSCFTSPTFFSPVYTRTTLSAPTSASDYSLSFSHPVYSA